MTTNPILNLYPLTKFYFALFIAATVIIVPNYLFAFAWFPVLILIAIGCGVVKPFLSFILKTLFILLVIVFFMQLFFYPGDDIIGSWWIFEMSQEGLNYGLKLSSRILAIGSAFILFFRIVEVKDFVKSLEDIGMPSTGAYVVLSTLQIIPEMRRQSNTIMEAQKTRGVETEGSLVNRAKAFFPTLTPLILSSIASTEERAITLEARAFSASGKKTSLHKLTKRPVDKFLPWVYIFIVIGLIIWRFFL